MRLLQPCGPWPVLKHTTLPCTLSSVLSTKSKAARGRGCTGTLEACGVLPALQELPKLQSHCWVGVEAGVDVRYSYAVILATREGSSKCTGIWGLLGQRQTACKWSQDHALEQDSPWPPQA